MIPPWFEVYLASKLVDFRDRPVSLMVLVHAAGVNDRLDGSLSVFRSRRSDKV